MMSSKRRRRDDTTQAQFNFTRADQEAALKALQLKSMSVKDGKTFARVSAMTLKTVLAAMADYCWTSGVYWASSTRLAKEINCHERTVRRAFTGLESIQCLMLLDKRIGCVKRYTIDWGEISIRTTHRDPGHSDKNPGHSDKNPGHSDKNPGHSDKNPGHDVRRTLINLKEPPPIQQPTSGWEEVEAVLIALPAKRRPTAWHDGLRAARARGVTTQYVLDLVEHYNAQGPAYSAGALYRRLQRSHPDVPPSQGWPCPSPSATVATIERNVSEELRRIVTPIVRSGYKAKLPASAIREQGDQALIKAGIDPKLWDFN
jgi:hypothetical protein